jgi:phosphoribosylformimino-5-aminoimidazole carboxamide ribotide isomerase
MMAIPAIDLREGKCVQLVGGSYAEERVRIDDPVEQAKRFREAGFTRLHLVDLDAATGRGSNEPTLRSIIERVPGLTIQLGGGVRSEEAVERWLEAGVTSVVIGTQALVDRAFLERVAARHPGRIAVALDVREREVLSRGWSQGTGKTVESVLTELSSLPLSFVLVTAVHVEGSLSGVDAPLYAELAELTRLPLVASGGVGELADLHALAATGVHGAVIGMALYVGRVEPREAASQFSSWERSK